MGCSQSHAWDTRADTEPSPQAKDSSSAPSKAEKQPGAAHGGAGAAGGRASALVLPPAAPDTRAFDGEADRIADLRACHLMPSQQPDPRFDRITALMASIFNVPVSVVSLIDDTELAFKSLHGDLPSCIGRPGSFCDFMLVPPRHEVLVVEDATKDARFSANPFVLSSPGIRFYAGAPLVSSAGHRLGSLCVIDTRPRSFLPELYNTLTNFADLAVREMEKGKLLGVAAAAQAEQAEQADQAAGQGSGGAAGARQRAAPPPELLRRASSVREGVLLIDTGSPGWPVLYANDGWEAATGTAVAVGSTGQGFWSVFQPDAAPTGTAQGGGNGAAGGSPPSARQAAEAALAAGQAARLRLELAGSGRKVSVSLRPAATDQLQNEYFVGIPNFVGEAADPPAARGSAAASLANGAGLANGIHTDGRTGATSPSASDASPRAMDGGAPAQPQSLWFVVLSPRTSRSEAQEPASLQEAERGAQQGGDPATRSPRQSSVRLSREDSTASSALSGTSVQLKRHGKAPPSALSDLQLGPLVGSGSFGRVFRAKLRGKQVAVKVLEKVEELPEAAAREALPGEREAALGRQLLHPHIVQTIEYAVRTRTERTGAAGRVRRLSQVWIVQQFCNRGTLLDAIDRGWLLRDRGLSSGPNPAAVVQTALDIASALSYLHSRDIVHADLTGRNVLLTSSPRDARRFTALVGDFGLAHAAADSKFAVGTVTHQPPGEWGKRCSGGTLSSRGGSDTCVRGHVLGVEMWGGCRTYLGRHAAGVVHTVVHDTARLELPEGTLPAYRELCHSCMQRDPAQRPDIDSVLRQLERMLEAVQQNGGLG
eukprot:scaffold4.g4652.t1